MKILIDKTRACSIKALTLILAVAVLSSCGALKVKLVGEYDQLIDESVHQLASKTTSFISKLSSNIGKAEGSYAQNKNFYSEAKGEVSTLINRAEFLEEKLKRTPLTDNFKMLKEQYEDLEALHQTPLTKEILSKSQEAFDQAFRAIVKHLVYLKWNQEQPKTN